MSQPKEHQIRTVSDFLRLTPDEFKRMLPDLQAFYELASNAVASGLCEPAHSFDWVDDGLPGEIHHVNFLFPDGETMVVKGPAFKEQA